ncbi:hypothetical protein TSUD_288230 [Trifolium subterraneum]|uniref:RRM domain-containing protein n=1 Tax=Trifolium subterraneum TaxID=3900 RepID=A0A2Z6NGN8_TRISU|nr:hypothetical protein TSUD_288230 [Trifolium subterraneum]
MPCTLGGPDRIGYRSGSRFHRLIQSGFHNLVLCKIFLLPKENIYVQFSSHQALTTDQSQGVEDEMSNTAAIEATFGGDLPPRITGTNERCTILVTNLNPDRIEEDKLFHLFSIYGNIMRIKILRK